MTETKKDREVVAFRREYVDVLDGDICAALMLSQIVYWYLPSTHTGATKLRVCKMGSGWWIAKSHKDWETELGLTRHQSQRALNVLIRKGLVQSKLFRFNGSPTVHVRLTLLKGSPMLSDAPTPVDFGYTPPDPAPETAPDAAEPAMHCMDDSTGLPPDGQTLTESTTETTTERKTGVFNATAKTKTTEQHRAGREEEKNTEKQEEQVLHKNSYNDGLAAAMEVDTQLVVDDEQQPVGGTITVKAKDVIERLQQKKGVVSLGGYWKQTLSSAQDGKYQKALTNKDLGQLKMLSNKLGEITVPVIDYCLHNWAKFAEKAKNAKGLATYPIQPHVGYLLAHHDVAVNLLQSIATKKEAVPAVSSECTNKVIIEKNQEKPYKPTQEDLDAFLAGLETS
jgi:hypothetical protein